MVAKPKLLDPPVLTRRYEQVRAGVIGESGGLLWGLNVLLRRGLAAWSRSVAPDDHNWGAQARSPGPSSPRGELIEAVARMVASRFAAIVEA